MRKATRGLAGLLAVLVSLGVLTVTAPSTAAAAPVGQGFTVTAADLAFILKQIKIAERHAATYSAADPCGTLVGSEPNQIPDRLTAYGLRTVDGSCNNLFPGRENYAAADQPFPRITTAVFQNAEPITDSFPVGAPGPTTYKQKLGSVVDSEPRLISNLIVDQTSTNPAAIAAAGFPVRTQGNPGKYPCTTDPDETATPPVVGVPAGCVPSHHTLDIPNVTTDVGLSPPYNSWFTFFGQFFDHGIDQTIKGGGTLFVPLRADDPLLTVGPDGKAGTGDEVPASQAFMVLTRAQNQPGPDGRIGTADDIQNATNTDSPWVDQSQTYTSHASHQVFLREYALTAGVPVSTGGLLGGLPGNGATGMATWAAVKKQTAEKLGLLLTDKDVLNVPMLAVDPYGKFLPGPHGLPQYATLNSGLVEGDLASPVAVPADAIYFNTPFLTDIAHHADPTPQDTDHNPSTPPVAPAPDSNDTASADFTGQPAGTYDNEMLDAHFIAGDGRVNENIALTAVHQIFHSEHERLVADIKNILSNDTSGTGTAALAEWKLDSGADGWNGERLFQAARFINEMEYQHLVFEEFGRKTQPAIRAFRAYSPDINPAIGAEFAHAVYRFGHSMLDDEVSRKNANGSNNSVPLLGAFTNPLEYYDGGSAGGLTPEQAAGSIVMGSVDQVGNELDEFVTETLRNNLLGLPLDLATLNLGRAREAGVAPLNSLRRQLHAATNDGQLAPYTSWSDFGQNIKHPESLINFVAAYGTHPSIVAQPTAAGKRAAAKAIVDPGVDVTSIPEDAADFMFSTGPWSNTASGVTTTGLDDVDLWVGGLAEITNVNGGLLGSTFNYVFQNQMENLQDADRFYYLNRTPGMNLRAQLEGNSFAELIGRNTAGVDSLKADVFSTADCKFQLSNLIFPAKAGSFISGPGSVQDDPASDCNENRLLLQKPDGTVQYRQVNSVDPAGINGQSVYNGTESANRLWGGNDNDTFWGGEGNDVIEGNGGDDVTLGGNGNDVITDLSGADIQKGGPGNDALDGGIGGDIALGGDGADFINGGSNDNVAFGGPGSDFLLAGQGADGAYGDGGDDWIQGGSGQDLLIGDHGAPFFDDPAQAAPGNDIFIGQVGENDYDAEGGDDLMAQNAAVDRNAGAAGFDWAFHQFDTVAADDDLEINNNLSGLALPLIVNRDRWQEVEAVSGSAFDDSIKGTSVAPSSIGGAGFSGCDVLDQAAVDRISGLNTLLPQPLTGDPNPVIAGSVMGYCPISGAIWGDGDILLGGAGSDTFTGRGADDIIDGDKYLAVRISVRTNPADPATEIGSTDLMEHSYQAGSTRTLQQDVFAGIIDPGNLVIVREILSPPTAANTDTAVFTGPLRNYTVSSVNGKVTVTQVGANVVGQNSSDGTDTLTNIEKIKFSDETISLSVPGLPTIGTATAGNGSATVEFTAAAAAGQIPTSGFTVAAVPVDGSPSITGTVTDETATSATVNGLTNGVQYRLQVAATNAVGTSAFSGFSNAVTPAPAAAPTASLSPSSLTFAGTVGAPGPAQVVTLTNSGNASLFIFSRLIDGTDAANFALGASTCVGTLAAGASCTTSITFNPTATGTSSAMFIVTDNAPGGPHTVSLAGTATAPADTTVPTVTARVPAPDAATVVVAADISVTFSEGVSAVDGTTFELRAGTATTGAAIAATVTQVAGTNTWVLNPNADLVAGSRYTVALTGGASQIRDLAGNPLASTSWSFTTAPAADTTAPTVTARVPAGDATTVAAAADISVTFSEAVSTVNPISFAVRASNATTGAAIAATVTQVAGTNTWLLNPNANLAAGTRYTVTLTGGPTGIRDLAGNPLPSTSWSFTTAPAADTTAPTVTARVPAVNATSVVVAADVSVTFSEAISTVNPTTFAVRAGAATTGSAVAATVTQVAGTNTWVLNPNANLAAGSRYTVALTGGANGIRDLAGNQLVSTTWSFTTAAADTTAPTVTTRTPDAGALAQAVGSDVTATFSETVVGVNTGNASLRVGTAANGNLIPAAITYNATTRVMTLNPNANLAVDTLYTVRLASGITDSAANRLAATSWSFRTGPAPSVTSRTPAVNATSVRRSANITVTFSEPVTGVAPSSVTVRLGTATTGALIRATVSYNAGTRVVTIDPNANLAANTKYTVRLSTAIVDAAGNPLPLTEWSFTTGQQ